MLVGARQGQTFRVRARFVVDATGPRGFLSRALGIENRGFDGYPPTQALFSHFTDVARCDEMDDFDRFATVRRTRSRPGREPSPPYPIDDAALHHVFDGGWMWVLRFGNGVTSAGVAVEDWLAEELRLADGEPAWARLLARYPSIAAQFADARPIRRSRGCRGWPIAQRQAAGERWAMLPSAAAFIDPLFSTGIPLTLLGIERLAANAGGRIVRRPASTVEAARSTTRVAYNDVTLADADHTARFIAGCYAGFRQFPMFAAYSMFYFAAASFSEMAAAAGVAARAARLPVRRQSTRSASALERLSPALQPAPSMLERYERDVGSAVADWNIAGLCDPQKRNWYPVDLEDTIRGAGKLGLTPEAGARAPRPVAASL